MGKSFQLHLLVATTCTYEKYINYNKNLELNINKNSELKNSVYKIKEFPYAQQSE